MDIIDIRLPKSLLVSKKSSEIVPGLVVDEQGSVSLVTWINSRISDGSISSIGGGSPSAAENISVSPSGNLTSTDVQTALVELQTDINNFSGGSNVASDITVVPSGNLGSTNVQAALAELQGDIDTLAAGGSSAAADITVVASGNLASTNVQAALLELQGDIDTLAGGGSDGNGIYDGNGTLSGTTTVNGDSNALVFNTLSNFQVTTTNSGFIMNTNEGIRYNADYSANFSARSLVDKGYVDAEVGAIGAPNTDGTMIIGDGSVGNPITLGEQGADNHFQVLSYDINTSSWVPKELWLSGDGTLSATASRITYGLPTIEFIQTIIGANEVIGRGWFYNPPNASTDPIFKRTGDEITIDSGSGVNKLISASVHFNTSILSGTDLVLKHETGSAIDYSVRTIQIYNDNILYDIHSGTVTVTYDGFIGAPAASVTWTIANIDTLNDVIIVVS